MASYISYADPAEFYKSLKKRQQNSTKERTAMPSNQKQIVNAADSSVIDESLKTLVKNFKPSFVIFSILLNAAFKNKITEYRKNSLNAARENNVKRSSSDDDNTDDNKEYVNIKSKNISSSLKVSREDCIPDSIRECQSNVAKAAVAMFCMHSSNEILRKKALFHILNGECKTMNEVMDLVKSTKETIRKLQPKEIMPEIQQLVIQGFMELAEITRDKSHSKFAMAINEAVYILSVKYYLEKNTFTTICPYDALIARYLKACIAPISIDNEQLIIQNQFQINPKSTITYLLDSLPTKCNNREGTKSVRFDETIVYEAYKGAPNYNQNLIITNITYENKIYRIITYNDCLYDVIGCTIDVNNSDSQCNIIPRESILYNNLSWSERLTLIPYRAKIELSTITGKELNDFKGSATITLSWMEKGLECSKTYNFSRKDSKKDIDM